MILTAEEITARLALRNVQTTRDLLGAGALPGQFIGRRWLSSWSAVYTWLAGPVVVLVSCIPVITLGLAAALTDMLSASPGPDAPGQTTADSAASQGPVHRGLRPEGDVLQKLPARRATPVGAGDAAERPGRKARPGPRPRRKPRPGTLVTAEDVAELRRPSCRSPVALPEGDPPPVQNRQRPRP